MELSQIREVVEGYETCLYRALTSAALSREPELALGPKRYDSDKEGPAPIETMRHLLWMCGQISRMTQDPSPNVDKINRWLGFVQGVLWDTGIYSIGALRSHNRSVTEDLMPQDQHGIEDPTA